MDFGDSAIFCVEVENFSSFVSNPHGPMGKACADETVYQSLRVAFISVSLHPVDDNLLDDVADPGVRFSGCFTPCTSLFVGQITCHMSIDVGQHKLELAGPFAVQKSQSSKAPDKLQNTPLSCTHIHNAFFLALWMASMKPKGRFVRT